jgi:predicted acylesterase/phospholipase RssA
MTIIKRALVLGGGGSTGNAWLIGIIAGLFDAGLDVTEADLIIGTSAGSTTAAQIAGAPPTQLLADILSAAPQQRNGSVGAGGGRVPIAPASSHLDRDQANHRSRQRCSRHAPRNRRRGAGDGRRVEQVCADAVARHRRCSAAEPGLAAATDAHHGGRRPQR